MLIRFCGIAGLVVFLFGFLASLIIGSFTQPIWAAHMLLGAALIISWFLGYGLKNFSETGAALKGRTIRFSANALLYSLVFAGFLAVANFLAYKHDYRWDLTENSVNSLSPQTQTVLNNLQKPVRIVAFKGVAAGNEFAIEDLLELYKYGNPAKIKSEIVDARTDPTAAETYQMKPGDLLYIEYGEGTTASASRVGQVNEQTITNAIIKLSRGSAKKVYYVEGHDEPDITSDLPPGLKSFAKSAEDEHLTMEGILLSQKSAIPEDAAALVLCAPKKPLLPQEKELIKKYVDDGGRLLLFNEPRTTADIKELAAHFKIIVGEDVVIDQLQRLFGTSPAQPMVRNYTPHAITKGLKGNNAAVFGIASSVRVPAQNSSGETYTELAKTGNAPGAWAETDLDKLFNPAGGTYEFDEKTDLPGPISLAAAYEKKHGADGQSKDEVKFEKISRVVVFGDSDWILNANLLKLYSNRDLVLNALNWLAGEEGGVSIGKKNMRMSDAPMTLDDFRRLFAGTFIVPELILLLGMYIWWKRRSARA